MADKSRLHLFLIAILALVLIVIVGSYVMKIATHSGDIGVDFSTVPLEKLEAK